MILLMNDPLAYSTYKASGNVKIKCYQFRFFFSIAESDVLVPMEIGLRFSAAALMVLVSITAWPVQCSFDPLQQMQDATITDVVRQHGRDIFVAKGKDRDVALCRLCLEQRYFNIMVE